MFTRFLFLLCRLKSNLQFACAKFAWMRCWCSSCCSCCCFIFAIKIVCHLCAKWQLNFVSMQRCVCMCGCVFVWVVWGLELCAKLAYLTFQWANICTNTNTKTCKVCFTHRCCVFSYVCVGVSQCVSRVCVCCCLSARNGELSKQKWLFKHTHFCFCCSSLLHTCRVFIYLRLSVNFRSSSH